MMILKNEGIEKDDNDKNKQYQKREDIIFSFFRKPRKIGNIFVSYDASVIKLVYIISPWRIAHATYGLKSLTN